MKTSPFSPAENKHAPRPQEQKMKIIHFVENYIQVTETFIYNFITKSAQYGEVAIVTFQVIHQDHFPLPGNVRIYEIPSDPVLARKDLAKLPWMLWQRLTGRHIWYKEFSKIIAAFGPDLIHCHFGVTGVFLTDFLRHEKRKIPFITNFYGYDASELPRRDPVYAAGLTRLWQDSSLVLSEGPVMSLRLQQLGAPASITRLSPIIVDGSKYPVRPNEDQALKSPIRFLLIGRFVEKKGFHLFLEAIGRIQHELPDFMIILVGSGPMMETYQQIIAHHGLGSKVSFEGMKPLSACIQYMLSSDVLVHPSVTAQNGDSEGGAPTILIEAQLVGIPVIASTHADIPFVMGYDDFLAEEGNVDDLSRVIKRFTGARDLSDKIAAGRQKASLQHDMKNSTAYRDILLHFQS